MRTLYVDLETKSQANLGVVGADRYFEDPEAKVLIAAYAFDDEPVHVLEGHDEVRRILGSALLDPAVLKVAHNARFDRLGLTKALGGRHLDPEQWEDTMALAANDGLPLSLEALGRALRVEEKDSAGKTLIRKFSIPNREGRFVTPEQAPAAWVDYLMYAAQDVDTLREVHRKLPSMHSDERRVWVAEQRVVDRGMLIDIELATAAEKQAAANSERAIAELRELTGLDNPNSIMQLGGWLDEQDCGLPDLRAATVQAALDSDELPANVRRVLELRQETALSAAKKFSTGVRRVCADDRVRGAFRYFGAHTGRWSGSGLQPQNLPRASLAAEEIEPAIDMLKLGLGADANTLKALVRPLFYHPDGIVVVDFASIEARVLAWLAGEEWALQAFRDRRDIYVETAKMMSTPTREFNRQEGKTAVLGLGYGGGVNALLHMGATAPTDELQLIVDVWRDTNPQIVGFWRRLERAFINGGRVGEHITVERKGGVRRVILPSGRAIVYRGVRTAQVEGKFGKKTEASFVDVRRNLSRVTTWGGTLTENCTQAVARDLLGSALVRLDEAGYAVTGHVHDEVIVEAAEGEVETITKLMIQPPEWAAGLPIDAEGDWGVRYRK